MQVEYLRLSKAPKCTELTVAAHSFNQNTEVLITIGKPCLTQGGLKTSVQRGVLVKEEMLSCRKNNTKFRVA
jgi:hypothetical protein